MRFVVYGAGAIGGTLGALLSRAGHEVQLIARGAHLSAIRTSGLVVESARGRETYDLPATDDPAEVAWKPGDVVLLATKSQDTEGAIRALAGAIDRAGLDPASVAVACLQNAVANEPAVLRYFPRVYGVCVMFPATHLEPGVVRQDSFPTAAILDIGRYPQGPVDATARSIAAAFESADCRSVPRDAIMPWKYTKLLRNLGNAVDAMCGSRLEEAGTVVERLRAEGRAVYEAAGIPFVSFEQDDERRGDILRSANLGSGRGGSSSWQSLARGTGSIEADYLNGEIVWLGRLHGVPTSANDRVRALAVRFATERREPGTLDPAELLDALDA